MPLQGKDGVCVGPSQCRSVAIFDIQQQLQSVNRRQQEGATGRDNDGQHETEEEATINRLTGVNVS